ncbi:hypothetical protein ACIA5C_02150 [Actinoplanes sp. NPDC051343]|uniref:hypothetical protein n=1 Tax=Actinoplanes sp. NPDC051343 TaxID=3363906 RepID=UPI0037B0EC54
MTAGPQATFVVEYPCDQFCRIEVDLSGERGQFTLQQMLEKAEKSHQLVHEPERAEDDQPAAEPPEATARPAATVFLSAPGRGGDRRR